MQAVYRLWEGSWEDDAVRRDRTGRRFADPDKIHRIRHEGKYLRMDEPLRFDDRGAMTSALEAFTIADPDRVWTVREIAKHAAIGGRGPVVVGSPQEVADEMQAWVAETDIDCFNLAYAVTPETF